jgi:hypothetical protein
MVILLNDCPFCCTIKVPNPKTSGYFHKLTIAGNEKIPSMNSLRYEHTYLTM